MNMRYYRDKAKEWAELAEELHAESIRREDLVIAAQSQAAAQIASAYAQLAQVERVTPLA